MINYKKPADVDIESAWTEIARLSRKIVEMEPDMKAFKTQERRFQILLKSLPEDYYTHRDAIDAQTNPDIDDSIKKLQEKEAELQVKDKELAMLGNWRERNDRSNRRDDRSRNHTHRRHRSNSLGRSVGNNDRRIVSYNKDNTKRKIRLCFLCDGNHPMRKCDMLEDLRKLLRKKSTKAKQKAYNAKDSNNNVNSSGSEDFIDIDFEDEEEVQENCRPVQGAGQYHP